MIKISDQKMCWSFEILLVRIDMSITQEERIIIINMDTLGEDNEKYRLQLSVTID